MSDSMRISQRKMGGVSSLSFWGESKQAANCMTGCFKEGMEPWISPKKIVHCLDLDFYIYTYINTRKTPFCFNFILLLQGLFPILTGALTNLRQSFTYFWSFQHPVHLQGQWGQGHWMQFESESIIALHFQDLQCEAGILTRNDGWFELYGCVGCCQVQAI